MKFEHHGLGCDSGVYCLFNLIYAIQSLILILLKKLFVSTHGGQTSHGTRLENRRNKDRKTAYNCFLKIIIIIFNISKAQINM